MYRGCRCCSWRKWPLLEMAANAPSRGTAIALCGASGCADTEQPSRRASRRRAMASISFETADRCSTSTSLACHTILVWERMATPRPTASSRVQSLPLLDLDPPCPFYCLERIATPRPKASRPV